MKTTLLKALLKSKAAANDEIEALIDRYLKEVGDAARKRAEEVVSEVIVYVIERVGETDKATLLELVEAKLSQTGYRVPTETIETIYDKTAAAAAASVGASFVFDKTDKEILASVYRALVWLKDDASEATQRTIKEVLAAALEGEIEREALGEILREALGKHIDETARYFQGTAEHVIRQAQNLTKVHQFEKARVEAVKIVAVIDTRTSAICKSMHGRIVPLAHLTRQADAIRSAQSVEEKKAAAPWQSRPVFARKLPTEVGLPPYHFHCRTTVAAFFPKRAKIDGKNVNGSLLPGEKYKGKEVLFSHVDAFGYERVVTRQSIDHGGTPHHLSLKEILAGINAMDKLALHATHPKRTVGYATAKNLFFAFEDEEVVTAFKPKEKEKYFKKHAQHGTIENISVKKRKDDEER